MNYLELKKTNWVSISGLWLGRVVMVFMIFIFIMIGIRNLFTPVQANAIYKVTLGSPEAITNTRVGTGAFPLSLAIILVICVVSARRQLYGLIMVAIVDGLLTMARVYGAVVDGPATRTLQVMKPEIVVLVLSLVAITLEVRRRNQSQATNTIA